MDNILKQLLDAELKAQQVVELAKNERDREIKETQAEVKRAEQRFEARIPEIHTSFSDKAHERAQKHIDELELRYQERRINLTNKALHYQQQAIDDVLDIVINTAKKTTSNSHNQ